MKYLTEGFEETYSDAAQFIFDITMHEYFEEYGTNIELKYRLTPPILLNQVNQELYLINRDRLITALNQIKITRFHFSEVFTIIDTYFEYERESEEKANTWLILFLIATFKTDDKLKDISFVTNFTDKDIKSVIKHTGISYIQPIVEISTFMLIHSDFIKSLAAGTEAKKRSNNPGVKFEIQSLIKLQTLLSDNGFIDRNINPDHFVYAFNSATDKPTDYKGLTWLKKYNLCVYLVSELFTEVTTDWRTATEFNIKNPTQMKTNYNGNSNEKPRGYELIDRILKDCGLK